MCPNFHDKKMKEKVKKAYVLPDGSIAKAFGVKLLIPVALLSLGWLYIIY